MTAYISALPVYQFFDANGNPLAGGKLYSYAAGTSTPLATYTDSTGIAQNTNPIILDTSGKCQFWIGTNAYKFNLTDAGDIQQGKWPVDNIQAETISQQFAANLLDASNVALGDALMVVNQPFAGAVPTTQHEFNSRIINVFDGLTDAQKTDVKSRSKTLDLTTAIQAVLDSQNATATYNRVYFPPGAYKITAPLVLRFGTQVVGFGRASTGIHAYGCDAFQIVGNYAGVCDLSVLSYSSLGVADPRTYKAFDAQGTSGSHVSSMSLSRVATQGFECAANLQYVWDSELYALSTVNSNNGVRLFGQSVNNSIANSNLQCNSGVSCISSVKDGAVASEGLMVSNTLMSGAQYGINLSELLGCSVTNCILDLITNAGINSTDSRKLCVSNSWIYAANAGINLAALGSLAAQGATFSNNSIHVTANTGKGVSVGGNNSGISITGGSIECVGALTACYCVYSDAASTSVVGTHLINPSANSSVFFGNVLDCVSIGNTGNDTVTYTSTFPQKVYARLNSRLYVPAYGATVAIDAARGNFMEITATNGTAFTISDPTNGPTTPETQEITITVRNTSGGALGTITWGSAYKLASFTNPATGYSRSISFRKIGSNWIEIGRTTSDVPN